MDDDSKLNLEEEEEEGIQALIMDDNKNDFPLFSNPTAQMVLKFLFSGERIFSIGLISRTISLKMESIKLTAISDAYMNYIIVNV